MIAAIIQARMSSSRLPGKVMLDLAGAPVLVRVVERVRSAKLVDVVAVATSTDPSDDPIAALCEERNIALFRGPLDDVLARYIGAAHALGCETIVRITSDCPLIDPSVIDLCIETFLEGHYDYISNCAPGERTFPRGLDVEVCATVALERADRDAKAPYEREHVMPFIWENKKNLFSVGPIIKSSHEYRRPYRLTLDYAEDYELTKRIYAHFQKPDSVIDVPKALRYLDNHPELIAINAFREADHQKHAVTL
ncbi:hypothetical protein A3C86_04710 [Candidatus Kaiserbacteria bacterium RIFCSPHIGHO2_02_FULL_49_16]|uniref:Acylneuraminate cytidylyltransferase n=1 Tax=Candidatus Kaiserbacteria bacterium RIFCSPHIGHO2_02_FULL_49_16 TaxID=1798490 RepID=A0A1F6DGI1_9BACT|nr:MAG: hypothetical protein A3C86_04710 [Candidatus Kaiserbacteria bacterium RIFCSPHIGHO2_02_FULL_49_16]